MEMFDFCDIEKKVETLDLFKENVRFFGGKSDCKVGESSIFF